MLTNKQRSAVMALASGNTVKQASEIAGCGERSIYRWLNDDEFNQAVNLGYQEQLERISRKLATYAGEAIEVLYGIMVNSRSEHQRRLASNSLIEHHNKFRDVLLESRVSELERRYYEHREESK